MIEPLKTIVVLCIFGRIFEFLLPDNNMKKQLTTVNGLVFVVILIKTIVDVFKLIK